MQGRILINLITQCQHPSWPHCQRRNDTIRQRFCNSLLIMREFLSNVKFVKYWAHTRTLHKSFWSVSTLTWSINSFISGFSSLIIWNCTIGVFHAEGNTDNTSILNCVGSLCLLWCPLHQALSRQLQNAKDSFRQKPGSETGKNTQSPCISLSFKWFFLYICFHE